MTIPSSRSYEKTPTYTFGSVLFGIVAAIAILGPFSVYEALVISTLWRWFIQDIFPTAPGLGIANAIGLSTLIGMLVFQYSSAKDVSLKVFLYMATMPAISLLIGWIVLLFR